jgi:aspartate/methionine/tyrosine aminotransferase
MPEWLAEKITQMQVNSNSCPNSFVQFGGLAALQGPQDESRQMVAEFQRRRDVIVEGLNSLQGVSCLKPGGAFYVFPNVTELVKKTGKSTKELADYFLNEAGVAVLSGTAFGEYGEGYLRLSYANSVENIQKAIDWMGQAIRKLG